MQFRMKVEKHLNTLYEKKGILIEYLYVKIDEEDYSGASEAAIDINSLEVEIATLKKAVDMEHELLPNAYDIPIKVTGRY